MNVRAHLAPMPPFEAGHALDTATVRPQDAPAGKASLEEPKRSIGTELDQYGGSGPGFDVLRIGLALLILFGHTRWIANGTPPALALSSLSMAASTPAASPLWHDWMYPRHAALVPMFFALSGFLVTASAMRTRNVARFLSYRALRILPALVTEVTLSALLLGTLLTAWPLKDYFADKSFWQYFGNIVGDVHFLLPGLFLENPAPSMVNINLWTLPSEFYCYLIVAVAMATSLFYDRRIFSAAFLITSATLIMANSALGAVWLQDQYPGNTYVIVYYFFSGCFIWFWRYTIPLRPPLLVFSIIAAYFLLLSTRCVSLAPPFLAYVTIYIGLIKFPRLPFLQSGDYSYGVYLYGFPIAQSLVAVSPYFRGRPWELLAASMVATLTFAAVSWHLIEKRFLGLKSKIRFGKPSTENAQPGLQRD